MERINRMRNNSLLEISKILDGADSILFLTHYIVDGDSAGSALALCRLMREKGKTAHIFTGEKLPNNLRFLEDESFIQSEALLLDEYDIVATIDCSDTSRFENRAEVFKKGKISVSIDHHETNDYYADYNYVDPDAAATGEIIYELFDEANWSLSKEAAEALYTAIVTDTGQFQYDTTTSKTHRIAAALHDLGIDINKISINLYQSVNKNKYIIQSEIFRNMEFREDFRFALAYSDLEMLQKTGAQLQDTDGMIEMLRNIDSVEVAAFAKETSPGVMKLGFRSKYDINVAELALKFGGGGHKKASGCSINGDIEAVKKVLYPEISKLFMKERA